MEDVSSLYEEHALRVCCFAFAFDGTYATIDTDTAGDAPGPRLNGAELRGAKRVLMVSTAAPRRPDPSTGTDAFARDSAPDLVCVRKQKAARWTFSACGNISNARVRRESRATRASRRCPSGTRGD
jgi:hypothetical protein